MANSALTRRLTAPLLALVLALFAAQAALADRELAAHLPGLAESGQFDQLLSTLQTSTSIESPSVASLVRDLERYKTHVAESAQKRQEAYDKAVSEMARYLDAGRVQDALLSAIEAQGLTDNPNALLTSAKLMDLVNRATAAADQAKADGDWLEVLDIYRRLNLLFDAQGTYLAPTRDAERHVRVMRMYAPRTLEKLLQARADERKKRREQDEAQRRAEEGLEADTEQTAEAAPDEAPIELGDETWQQRLDGVKMNTTRQALVYGASRHVDAGGWSPILKGAVNALSVMLNTPQIVESFPAIADANKVGRFHDGLVELNGLIERSRQITLSDATRMLDRIIDLNRQTVDLPDQVLAYEIADGGLSNLDDFSTVVWPYDMEQFSRSFSGKFFGVGVQIAKRDGRLIVVSPLADTPAMRAGIKAGDVIATVNGQNTDAWTLDKAVREITGPEGSFVTLGIERTGENGILEYRIQRAEIPIESVRGWAHREDGSWDYFIDPVSRIGYVRLSQFIPQTADELDAAINQMERERPLSGLIIDLRFNPGGLLSSAVDVCDRFIASGPLVSTVDSTGAPTSEARARREHTHRNFPIVVLINQGSASASEIVSGALQDYARALVVGERSFGKGSVQDLFKIDGGRVYLKLTTQYYKLPKGRIIHRKPSIAEWGIHPDLEIKMTTKEVAHAIDVRQQVDVLRTKNEPVGGDAEAHEPIPTAESILSDGIDAQLEAAVLVLKTRLVAQSLFATQTVKNDAPVPVTP